MRLVLFFSLIVSLILPCSLSAESEYPEKGQDIYDTKVDGASLIAEGVKAANMGDKRVLLDFGANWCPWCRQLHKLMAEDPAISKELAAHYVVVMIDVNTGNRVKRNATVNSHYGNPTNEGLPVLGLLERTGRRLTTREQGAFESRGSCDSA